MTLKISFKSLHVNACHLPFLLLCAETVWKLRLDIRQKMDWYGSKILGGWLAVFLLGKVLFGCREKKALVCWDPDVQLRLDQEGRAGGRKIHRESEAPIPKPGQGPCRAPVGHLGSR